MGLIVPSFVLAASVKLSANPSPENTEPSWEYTYLEATEAQNNAVMIAVMDAGKVEEKELENYLVEVVLAEMPASFEMEALKAQAVVARTYTLRAHEGKRKHEQADVCTDYSCCQAYCSEEEYLLRGGSQESIEKIRTAVTQTAGWVLTYKGDLIEATYFSCSGGSTEDAVAVWGTEVPYLRSVESPGGERAAYYEDAVIFTRTQLIAALNVELSNKPDEWIGEITYTAGGGVKEIQIGGKLFAGTELRKLLKLRSTAFKITPGESGITVVTRGYGHRVGMSQYGADAMASSGSTYPEILSHYYQGTTLEEWSIDKVSGIG
jgi:stage II sporulation protein D